MNRERLLDLLASSQQPLPRYLNGIVPDHHLAEELTQETLHIPHNTARSRLFSGLRRLRRALAA